MLKHKSAGWTLVELMVAIGVLAITTTPIIMLYQFGTRMAAAAHRQTIAAVLAQQRVEELVGLSLGELNGQYSDPNKKTQLISGMQVVLNGNEPKPVEPYTRFEDQEFTNKLAEVTVQVLYDSADPIVEQTVVIALAQ